MDINKKPKGCIVTFPISASGNVPLSNLVDILIPLTYNLYLITGNAGYEHIKNNKNIHIYCINHKKGANAISRIFRYIWTQLMIAYTLFKLRRKTDFYLFFIGGEGLIIPVLTTKLLNKKIILAPADYSMRFGRGLLSQILRVLSKITRVVSDKIIIYSPNLIKEWSLEKYKDKISIAHEHFLDFDKFKIKKRVNERSNLVGYIGRLSEEKGVLNFVRAIPKILEKRDEIRFLVCGDGQLRDDIKDYLDANNLNDKVKLTGWIHHDELPDYLNDLKLIVLPSYTEGLPNVMLEAMACGTLVLATPVGGIPDIIKDGETGFILENNSPECIAENVIRALDHLGLQEIADNAKILVEKNFTYEIAVNKYKKILMEI